MAASMAKAFSRVPLSLLSSNRSKLIINCSQGFRRHLLSVAYTDNDGWVPGKGYEQVENMDVLYSELKGAFDMVEHVGAPRVDRFVDNIQGSSQCDRAVELMQYLRQSTQNHLLRSCTSHSLIRSCLNYNQEKLILKVLRDKCSFGIFPDPYCSHLILDKFIKDGKLEEAVSFSVELMKMDEIYGNKLTELLCLNCCHHQLMKKSPSTDDNDSDMFEERIGKTLVDCCLSQSSTLHQNYLLIGLCLSEQFPKMFRVMESILSTTTVSKLEITDEIPSLFERSLSRWKSRMEVLSAGPSEEPIDPFNPPKDPEEIFRRTEAYYPIPGEIDEVTVENIRNSGPDAGSHEEISADFDKLWKRFEDGGLVVKKLDLGKLLEEEVAVNLKEFENQELALHKQNMEEHGKQRYYMNMTRKNVDAALKGEIHVCDIMFEDDNTSTKEESPAQI